MGVQYVENFFVTDSNIKEMLLFCDSLDRCHFKKLPTMWGDLYRRYVDAEVWVVVYGVNQEFGGHEEGGWWYDNYQVYEAEPVTFFDTVTENINAAEKMVEQFRKELYYNEPSHSQYDDTRYSICIEFVLEGDEPGHSRTTTRPHYE